MSKTAFVILAAGDTPESLGRVVNALMGALEYADSGDDVQIIFDGAGTQAAAGFAQPDHKYHELFQKVRGSIAGACSYCAGAYEVKERLEAAQLPLLDEFKGHPSLKQLIDAGYTLLTF
jgi:hypothetical protein